MRADPIARFVQLHRQLTSEKKHLEERLAKINRALLSLDSPRGSRSPQAGKRGTRNFISLREAIVRATSGRPLTKPEIYEAVEALGYRFTGKDPMNAINVQLYTKGQFKRNGRKFSPASALLKTSGTKSLAPHSRGVRLKHKFRLN
ncbi:MAG: hypothetical protein QOF48_2738 [Verrucomicrobiota bacterium]|jgi:hypothetical protein